MKYIVSHFYGILIKLEYKPDSQPCFYAWYMGSEALFNLEGEKLSGDMPHVQELLIIAWAELRRAEIAADWEAMRMNYEPFEIGGIEL